MLISNPAARLKKLTLAAAVLTFSLSQRFYGQSACKTVGPAGGCFLYVPPKVELLSDGRMIKVLAQFAYIDSKEIDWEASRNLISDGASIPRFLWTPVGGPLEGKYRNAAIVHDQACRDKFHTRQDTHLAFYNAMLDSDVGRLQAKLFYLAVYARGPRWKTLKRGFGDKEEMEKEIAQEKINLGNDPSLEVSREPRYFAGPVFETYVINQPLPPSKVSDKKLAKISKKLQKREVSERPFSLTEIEAMVN